MSKLLRLVVLASVVAGLFTLGGMTASPAAASANFPLRLTVFEAPGTGVLAGRLENVDPSLAFVTVTVMLRDGTSLSVNVDASTNWQFSFGVLPDDGFIGISVTEVPIPQPTLIGSAWDYGYRYGFYYGYPFDDVSWGRFPGYAWPAGYGWGYYPFGYYAYAHYLNYSYGVPFYWNYPPLSSTPSYVYYGICGLPNTYIAPTYQYSYFGRLYQPTYAVSAAPITFGTPVENTYQVAAQVNPAPVQTPATSTVVVPASNGRELPVVIPDNQAKQQATQNNVAPVNVQAAPAANPAIAPANGNRTLPVTIPDAQAKQQATNNAQPAVYNAAPTNNAPAPAVNRQQVVTTNSNPPSSTNTQQQPIVNKAPVVNQQPPAQVTTNNVVNTNAGGRGGALPKVVSGSTGAPAGGAIQAPPPAQQQSQTPIVKPLNTGQRPGR